MLKLFIRHVLHTGDGAVAGEGFPQAAIDGLLAHVEERDGQHPRLSDVQPHRWLAVELDFVTFYMRLAISNECAGRNSHALLLARSPI